MKRSPLKRGKPLERTRMKQKPRGQRAIALEFTPEVKAEVLADANGHCQMCAGKGIHYHHRKLRSNGGGGETENCLLLCGRDHALIHAEVRWSYGHGLLVKSHNDPATVGVWLDCERDCAIDHAGQLSLSGSVVKDVANP